MNTHALSANAMTKHDDDARDRRALAQFLASCALSGIEFNARDRRTLEPLLNGEKDVETFIADLKQRATGPR
jgi:hypothetical protein